MLHSLTNTPLCTEAAVPRQTLLTRHWPMSSPQLRSPAAHQTRTQTSLQSNTITGFLWWYKRWQWRWIRQSCQSPLVPDTTFKTTKWKDSSSYLAGDMCLSCQAVSQQRTWWWLITPLHKHDWTLPAGNSYSFTAFVARRQEFHMPQRQREF